MKPRLALPLAVALLVLPATVTAQTVTINHHLFFDTVFAEIPGYLFGLSVFEDAGGAELSEARFDYISNSVVSIMPGILDGGADWYAVQPGDAFGKDRIAGGVYSSFFPPVDVGSGDFYIGVATGTPRTSFGWVHLRPLHVEGAVTMVENVVAYDSPGIIVGTTILVPEPGAPAVLLCGVASVVAARRRGRETLGPPA